MKTKKNIILLSIFAFTIILISCNSTKASSEESVSIDTLNINEIVKINAEKHFQMISKEDSINNVNTEVLAIDSFTFKQNIDFRKKQINDSIKLTNNESKIMSHKKIIYLLNSIEKSLGQHVNDLISYKYKYTINTNSTKETFNEVNKRTTTSSKKTTTVFFYTDATNMRQIIWTATETKDNILNPLEYPDYYKRIDRYESKN